MICEQKVLIAGESGRGQIILWANYRIQGHSGPGYANWLESFVERGR